MKHVIAFIAVVCGVALLFLTVGCKVKSSAKNQGQDENQSVEEYDPDFQDGKRSLDENDQQDRSSRGIEVVSSMNQYALLIGVNEYAKPIKSLQYCVKDMELLADCFQKVGVPKENIFLVTDNSSADRRPTGINIRRQIENVTRIMGRNDQLIIAFSGHGVQLDDKSYLCPSDTDLKDKNSVVSRDWVFEQLEKCKARQKVFIVDACRNEITFGGGKALGQVRTLEDPIGADTHGFILIASCDKTQQSWEHPEIQHGVFTYFLVEGLSGAAKDEDGYVTVLNLFQYASAKTKKYVLREFNEIQVPTFRQSGEMTDFCLAKVDDSQPIPVSPAPTPVEEPQPPVAPVSVQTTPELPKAGERQVKIVNGVEFAFRWCPPGKFKMGDDKHEVTLTKGFWMMETEVTQKQWKAVMGSNPSKFKGDDLPVETVLWNDCQDFCEECTQFGLPVQLPTEAQWEYACRAG
ncbi:MAG: caspase family protein, partial [Thermoguttaceae bacterium]|nr:caspase family protein [Thermoguttaceae bacterium]